MGVRLIDMGLKLENCMALRASDDKNAGDVLSSFLIYSNKDNEEDWFLIIVPASGVAICYVRYWIIKLSSLTSGMFWSFGATCVYGNRRKGGKVTRSAV